MLLFSLLLAMNSACVEGAGRQKSILLLHVLYLASIGLLFLYHVVYPGVIKGRLEKMELARLARRFNERVDRYEKMAGSREKEEEGASLEKVKRLIVYHEYLERGEIWKCLEGQHGKEKIEAMYSSLQRAPMGRPLFLMHSTECNVGIFTSALAPLFLIALANTKKLLRRRSPLQQASPRKNK